jgi:uncharacterized protein YyaL (SSP411 family)
MRIISLLLISLFFSVAASAAPPQGITWNNWSDDNFLHAQQQKRFVILDLEAVWCHWCHVMDVQTYQNPTVIQIIQQHFIAVRVDQDSRPDISNRYQDYGWPATIIFNSQGKELKKLAGFIEPEQMQAILTSVINPSATQPSPDKKNIDNTHTDPLFSKNQFDNYVKAQQSYYDAKNKGWGGKDGGQKYLDADVVEFAMLQARFGDKNASRMAKETLNAQLDLLDPVWGGMYQYSTFGDWKHPHYEKIMAVQADNIRIYAQAYLLWRDNTYLFTAEKIADFLKKFLMSPDGAFYTSMDADVIEGQHSEEYFKLNDADRRKQSLPKIDKHIYTRENGWVINALGYLYMASGNSEYLAEAERAASWIIKNRSLPDGGFSHDAHDVAGPYLGDTLAMARAFLTLYQITADDKYLDLCMKATDFIEQHFQNSVSEGGFVTAVSAGNIVMNQTIVDRGENVALVRLANLLYQYTSNKIYLHMAKTAMRYLVNPQIANEGYPAPILIANMEVSQDPLHITIVGAKDNATARALYQAALLFPFNYKRIEWWDQDAGRLPNPDVMFPALPKPAAFLCVNHRCSLPAYTPEDLQKLLQKLNLQK